MNSVRPTAKGVLLPLAALLAGFFSGSAQVRADDGGVQFDALTGGEDTSQVVEVYQAGDVAVLELRLKSREEPIAEMTVEIASPDGRIQFSDVTGFGSPGLRQVGARRKWSIPLTAESGTYALRADLKMASGRRVWLSQGIEVRRANLDAWLRHLPFGGAYRNSYQLSGTGESRRPAAAELRGVSEGYEKIGVVSDDGLPMTRVEREPERARSAD